MKDQSQKAPAANPAARPAAPGGTTTAGAGSGGNPGTGDFPGSPNDPIPMPKPGQNSPMLPPSDQAANPMLSAYMQSGNPAPTPASPNTNAPPQTYASGAPTGPQGLQFDATGNVIRPNTSPPPGGNSTSTAPSGSAPAGSMSNEWGSILGKLDLSNLPQLAGGDALRGQYNDARDAAYHQASGFLDPQWQNQQSALETKLANQGVMQNSEAWNKAMDDFGRQKEFAYGQARDASMNQGLAAQGQMFNQGLQANQNQFGQDLSSAGFTNSSQNQMATQGLQNRQIASQLEAARAAAAAQTTSAGINASASSANLQAQLAAQREQNQFNNSLTMHNQQLNEMLLGQQNPLSVYNSLNQGTSPQSPNFTSTPNSGVSGTDIASMIQNAYNGQMSGYNAQTGNANSNNAAMASIIAAIICDRRLKTNIRAIGKHACGAALYEFDYLWGEHAVGFMADELEEVRPDAVLTLPNGYKYVNMARL